MKTSHSAVPKEAMKILSQEIEDNAARYRVQASGRVHYITIEGNPELVYDEDILDQPRLLIPKLPPFPDSDWISMRLERDSHGELKSTISKQPLPGIESWHPDSIEVTSLKRIAGYRHRVGEVEFRGQSAIAKIAPFAWWNAMADRETLTYEIIMREHPATEQPIAPKFLGQLTEQGRVMGFLLEKVQGRPVSADDLPACETAVRHLHALGLVHGDINRHNFLMDETTNCIKMIDFEHARVHTKDRGEEELEELRKMFFLDPRLGTRTTVVDGQDVPTGPIPYRD